MHQKYPRNNFRSGPKNCAKKSQAFQQYRTKNFENKYVKILAIISEFR